MKINVVTVLNTRNYGTVLQTVATGSILVDLGFEVEFLDFYRKDQLPQALIEHRVKTSNATGFARWLLKKLIIIDQIKKKKVFRDFLKSKISLTTKTYYSFEDVQNECPDADVYCTGSDQMWNCGWNRGVEKTFFLEYAGVDKPRVALSTSIGQESWTESEKEIIIPFLKKYKFITVRENSAKKLLDSCGINSVQVLDPTLMVDKSFWKNMLGDHPLCRSPYLLVYKLHHNHGNIDFDKHVNDMAREKRLKVIEVDYSIVSTIKKLRNRLYLPKPEKFLNLFYYADYVVTDSFHGTAFSLNFGRQFSAIYPGEYSTRLDSVLELTGTKGRHVITNSIDEYLVEVDCGEVKQRLDTARELSRQIIEQQFKEVQR